MQRTTSRASDDDRHRRHHHHVIDISHLSQAKTHSPGRRMEILAAFSPSECPGVGRRGMWRCRAREMWIHAIPLVVLLCFCILWWFSYSVNLKIKDGRIITVHGMEMTQPLNETRVDLAILASATTPLNASVPQIQMPENEAEAQPVSSTD